MKIINVIIIFLAFLNYFSVKAITPSSNWIVDIKNENNTDDIIVLRPGIYTKITVNVRHAENIVPSDTSFDKTVFIISSVNNYDIILYPDRELKIIPSKSLKYMTYIGLNCNHSYKDFVDSLKFYVKNTTDLDGNEIDNANIQITPVSFQINNADTLIEIEPIETNLIPGTYSLFRLTKEIFNIEKVEIGAVGFNDAKFTFDNIIIEPFAEREILGEEQPENHGILFDYKFGTKLKYEDLGGETNATFNLKMVNWEFVNKLCFDISPKSKTFNIQIDNQVLTTLDDSIKQNILYNMEYLTPQNDKDNNLQIHFALPIAPMIIKCNLEREGKDEGEKDIQYNDYFVISGHYMIEFNNLKSNYEYNGECIFSSTSFEADEFEIKIGNKKENYDYDYNDFNSWGLYESSQCIEYILTSKNKEEFEDQIKNFRKSAEQLCNKIMIEDENIISSLKGDILCQAPDMKRQDNNYTVIICMGISPSDNSGNIKQEDIDIINNYFSKQTEKFIEELNQTAKKDFTELVILDSKRYDDLYSPDSNKINVEIVKNDGNTQKENLNFKIISSNEQPIECFYNKEMRSADDRESSMDLNQTEVEIQSIILYKNEGKIFPAYLKDIKEYNIYALYMNCYNLVGDRIRNPQNGILNAYRYVYIEDNAIPVINTGILDIGTDNPPDTDTVPDTPTDTDIVNSLDIITDNKTDNASDKVNDTATDIVIDTDNITDTETDNTTDTITDRVTDTFTDTNEVNDIDTIINDEDSNSSEQPKVTIRCSEKKNKKNPICLKGRYNNLNEILETQMPITDIIIEQNIQDFNTLSDSDKIDQLDDIFANFDEETENNKCPSEVMQNLINKERYLAIIDCSIFANGSSDNSLNELNNIDYQNCRENKKSKQKKSIEYLKNNLNCNYLSLLISKSGISTNVEYNIKYIIVLIMEMTNNGDSLSEGDSEVLFNIVTCLQENYEYYWNLVENYLKEKNETDFMISAIKKDITNLLIYSITNLVKILHFDEIDNYISEEEKNITSKGLMASKKGKQIYKSMKHFMKYFNEFGDGVYNISDSLIINVIINDEYKQDENKNSLQEENENKIKYEEQGINLLFFPQSMMKKYNAYAIQLVNYDSPLISIEANDDVDGGILNTFISITLYDIKGNEIKIDNIPEDIRPKILYKKDNNKNIDSCYFYNEETEDLSEKGVSINNSYIYNGNQYLKCTVEHLTCFTAGKFFSDSKSEDKGFGKMTFIILGGIFALILIFVIIICIVKKVKKRKKAVDPNIELETMSIIN